MRQVFRVFFVVLVLGGLVRSAEAKPTAEEYLKRGDVQMGLNNPAKAILNYTKAIELDPTFASAYVRRGIARRAQGSLNAAIQDFQKAESINPETIINNRYIADAYSNRGYIEMNDLDTERAISDFTKALHSYPDATHYHRRGRARLIEEDLTGAIEDFNRAISLNSHDDFLISMIHMHRGFGFLLHGNEQAAEADFRKSLSIHSGNKILIELHLRNLKLQIKQMRHRRVELRRNLS